MAQPISSLTMQDNRIKRVTSFGFADDDSQPFESDMGSRNSGDRIAANAAPMASIHTNIRDRRVCVSGGMA